MATYKVPQNVEADDKLIGPFSLKQFIFVILGMGFTYLAFFFFTKVNPFAAIPWIPPMVIFLVLGIYHRSDQPVEVYLASAIRFRLKPHKRVWDQEGYEERVIITAPPKMEKNYTKGYNQDQVSSHLGNLSRLMDTRGWASKLVTDWQNPALEAAAVSDRLMQPSEISSSQPLVPTYAQPLDVQDENSSIVAREFESKIQQAETTTHQNAMRALQQARDGSATDNQASEAAVAPAYTPYPTMHQSSVQPTAPQAATVAVVTPTDDATPDTARNDAPASDPVDPPQAQDTPTVAPPAQSSISDDEVEISLR